MTRHCSFCNRDETECYMIVVSTDGDPDTGICDRCIVIAFGHMIALYRRSEVERWVEFAP